MAALENNHQEIIVDHVIYHSGNSPIVLSIPHGGQFVGSDAEFHPRQHHDHIHAFCTDPDTNSLELGFEISRLFKEHTTKDLWLVAGQLHRAKCDYNRKAQDAFPPECCATQQSFSKFHQLIREALQSCVATFGFALLFDLHGQSHDPLTELGYMLGRTSLLSPDETLSKHAKTSLEQLHLDKGLDRAALIRGDISFGAHLATHGFFSCPSPLFRHPDMQPVCVVAKSLDGLAKPAEAHHEHGHQSKQARHCDCCTKCCENTAARCCARQKFYSGGYITQEYSKLAHVGVIQAETPQLVRQDSHLRSLFGGAFAKAIFDFSKIIDGKWDL